MGRFRFSMQNILQMKEKLETQAKNEYAQANARLLQEQEKLEILQNRLRANDELLKGELQESLTIVKIKKIKQDSEILETYMKNYAKKHGKNFKKKNCRKNKKKWMNW